MKDANLAIKQSLKLELALYKSHSCFFYGFFEDVKVTIGGLKIKHPIFVVEAEDHYLSLSQLFLKFVNFSQEYKLDEICGTITHLYTYQMAIFCILNA